MRIMVIIRHKTAHIVLEFCKCIHTVVNVNKSNVEMLILQTKGASPTYKWPFEGSHNEDVALGQNECDNAAECLLFLPVTTLSCCHVVSHFSLLQTSFITIKHFKC